MRLRQVLALFLIVMLISPGLSWATNENETEQKEPERKVLKHVFLITIEGISSKDLALAYTPAINGLAASGIKGEAIGVLPADTDHFLASLLTGASPEIEAIHGKAKLSLPAILDSNGRPAVIVDDGKRELVPELKGVKRVKPEKFYSYKEADQKLMDLGLKYFNKTRPFLTVMVLPGTEYAREKFSPQDKEAVVVTNRADEQVGRLLKELRSQGIYENSLVVVTGSPAKRLGEQKGFNPDSLMVPVVVSGPGLKAGVKIPAFRIVDIAPTVALLTGVTLNAEVDGLVLWNALQSGQGFTESHLMVKRLNDLSDAHLKSMKGSYKLINDKLNINIEKEKVNKEKREIENKINKKQMEIDSLKLKLTGFKAAAMIFVIVAGAGYIIEYIILRKKFLMF